METKFQTSFIPKKATPQVITTVRTAKISVAMLVGVIIFILSCSAAGAVFVYKKILIKQIETKSAELTQKKDALEPEFVETVSRLDKRITSARKIISGHTIVSPIFEFLQDTTLGTVKFDSFNYTLDENKVASIALSGQAKSFTAIALQSDIYNQDKRIKDPVFSGLNPNSLGNVAFKFSAVVVPETISFEKSLNINTVAPNN